MNTIQRFNQYLLERYPITWTTKILSIVGISLAVHLLFFIIGFTSYKPLDNSYNSNFGAGLVFFNIIISILILLFWVISLSKNNAFKDYYPTSANKLFIHFLHYFVIIFCATTFFISHQIGVSSYVNANLSKQAIEKEIEQVNQGAIFLSFEKSNYTGTNKLDEISYYNYNRTFISPFRSYYYNDNSSEMNSYVDNLLNSPDSKEKITKILANFLEIAKKYDVKTNLTVQKWLDVVYSDKETPFGVNYLIDDSDYSSFNNSVSNPNSLYLDRYDMRRSLEKQKNMFYKIDYILPFFHFMVWFSLIFAMVIFIIRTTSLRLFLLSLVTSALLSIGVGLLLFLIGLNSGSNEILLILPIFVCLLIIILPYFILQEKSDNISGILINISFPAFPLLVLLVVVCFEDFFKKLFHLLEDYFGINFSAPFISFAFFVTVLVFVYTRCYMFKKWKGLPEG